MHLLYHPFRFIPLLNIAAQLPAIHACNEAIYQILFATGFRERYAALFIYTIDEVLKLIDGVAPDAWTERLMDVHQNLVVTTSFDKCCSPQNQSKDQH